MPTVHTLTLNPVIDLIYQLPTYQKGTTIRCDEFTKIPAGKGFSVSYALSNLGISSEAYAPLGENDHPTYQQFCKEHSVKLNSSIGNFEVRQHSTVLEMDNHAVTHFQSTNNQISLSCVKELLQKLYQNITLDDIVCISGSLPSSLKQNAYQDIITECKKSGAMVILDTSGLALLEAVKAHPYAIKLNQQEAEELAEKKINSYQSAFTVLQTIQHISKIPLILVSMGEKGLIGGSEDGVWQMKIPIEPEKVIDTVGCGDSMVAGMIYGLLQNWGVKDILQYAIATATAATLKVGPGLFDQQAVNQLIHRIESQQIGEL